ncbi:peptidase C14, caspase domain-containing protein [Fomes fomentarius]|nr:peptidase C14, caspase domain-containing protein [Fomes fomentarius]
MELRLPHNDAESWKKLLIDNYKYLESEITMMLDKDEISSHLWPTRDNLVREIKALVADAKDGDKFMFYYAGHSKQVRSNSIHEEDGFDEAIMPYAPSGREAQRIIDNELHDWLVKYLPIGASLLAIFDTCHSGTLLDLNHYACNQVWYPWCNNGIPTLSEPRRSVRRRNACDTAGQQKAIKVDLNFASDAGSDTEDAPTPTQIKAKKPSVRIYERKRTTEDGMFKRNTLVTDLGPGTEKGSRRLVVTRSSTLQVTRRGSLMEVRKPRRSLSFDPHILENVVVNLKEIVGSVFGVAKHCSEPERDLECDGWCKSSVKRMGANVVSISACEDPQQTYENRSGWTMTQSMISVLKSNPHPPLLELIKAIGHDLHEKIVRKVQTRSLTRWVAIGKPSNQEAQIRMILNGSDPMLGSNATLTADDIFLP